MSDGEFKVYDAMLAMAKSDPEWKPGKSLVFHARRITLANATGKALTSVDRLLERLSKGQWISRQEPAQGRYDSGRWGTVKYLLVEHTEFAAEHGCPPLRYDPETSKLLGKPKRTVPQSWKTVPTFAVRNTELDGMVQGLAESTVPQSWKTDRSPDLGEHRSPDLEDKLVLKLDTFKRDAERNSCGPSPLVYFSDKSQNHGYGKARWLPIAEMQQAVLEETGHKVFFPAIYHGEIRRLAEEYGRDEVVAAVKELLNSRSAPGQTFNWRGFAGWLLNSECPRLRTVLLARRLYPSNHAAEQIKKAASA